MTLDNLYEIILERIREKSRGSYVAQLVKEGEDRVIQKVGEEAVEVIIAAKGKSRQRLVEEIADLYFMTLILLVKKDIVLDEIFDELAKRRKEIIKMPS